MGFDDLTKRQRVPVLRAVALDVLREHYGIVPDRLRLLSLSFNTLFRVDRVGEAPVVIRVCGRERIHAPDVERIEAAWLDGIRADLGLDVPTFVHDRSGGVVVLGSHPSVPRPVPCSVFTWVGGRAVGDRLDVTAAHTMGELLARLHAHAATLDELNAIASTAGVRADRVVYFGTDADVATLPGPDGALLAEAIDRVQRFLDDLWRTADGAPHLLHGDFGADNVMRNRGRLVPIDFQDLQFGFACQDLGLSLADLADDRTPLDVGAAFRGGYVAGGGTDLEPDQAETLAAHRSLNLIGFALASPRPGLEAMIRDEMTTIRRWMRGTSGTRT